MPHFVPSICRRSDIRQCERKALIIQHIKPGHHSPLSTNRSMNRAACISSSIGVWETTLESAKSVDSGRFFTDCLSKKRCKPAWFVGTHCRNYCSACVQARIESFSVLSRSSSITTVFVIDTFSFFSSLSRWRSRSMTRTHCELARPSDPRSVEMDANCKFSLHQR